MALSYRHPGKLCPTILTHENWAKHFKISLKCRCSIVCLIFVQHNLQIHFNYHRHMWLQFSTLPKRPGSPKTHLGQPSYINHFAPDTWVVHCVWSRRWWFTVRKNWKLWPSAYDLKTRYCLLVSFPSLSHHTLWTQETLHYWSRTGSCAYHKKESLINRTIHSFWKSTGGQSTALLNVYIWYYLRYPMA